MRFDLFFSLGNETQARFVSQSTGKGAEDERAQVPNGIQKTAAALEFLQPLFAPGQMSDFLGGGLVHRRFDLRVMRRERRTLVEGLGAPLPGVVHPHEARRISALGFLQGLSPACVGNGSRGSRRQSQDLDYIIYSAF